MRSSGSTRSLPDGPIRLGIVLVGDDHPRACTGRRLLRRGLARELPPSAASAGRAIVLDPYAEVPLTRADEPRARRAGLVAVDCSWNRLAASRAKRTGARPAPPGSRRLPMLLAANPQHFGRVGELNTVEALAAALWLLGHREEARRLLDGFAGGPAFLEVNRERLEHYARASTAERLVREERVVFGGGAPA